MATAIKIENLSKKYIIGHQKQEKYTALRDVLMHKMRGIRERIRHPLSPNREEINVEEFWALKDISLEIKQGDRVGVIGGNGAGKSTLLKVLSRITEPTMGKIDINGRVASLLEVGTGFHPELTGRENIFLNGAILGMGRKEIKRNFDEIVAFAEVEKFLDTPVKRYSSGMYVRLAFAVAAHLEPEILVVDEVLAVGDTRFQKKCLGKMEEVGKEGRTVLFVSHNMSAIQNLCTRCVVLDNGKLLVDQLPAKAIQRYLEESICSTSYVRSGGLMDKPTIVSAQLKMIDEEVDIKVRLDIEIQSNSAMQVSLDLRLTDGIGSPVGYGSLGNLNDNDLVKLDKGSTEIMMTFPIRDLASGTYYISLDIGNPDVELYDKVDNCLSFENVRAPTGGARRIVSQSWGFGAYEIPLNRS